MHKITLLCSAHRQSGLCNAAELLEILQAIDPEVVFEERRPSDLDSTSSLEASAITKYRECKLLRRVPVDRYDVLPDMLLKFKAETDRVLDCVEQVSQEYSVLNEEHAIRVHRYGFRYLNSAACESTMERIADIEEETILGTRDQSLKRALQSWRLFTQRRDREMTGNIYQYSRENVFDKGIFLVGAAHTTGIVEEIKSFARAEADLISWHFAYEGQTP